MSTGRGNEEGRAFCSGKTGVTPASLFKHEFVFVTRATRSDVAFVISKRYRKQSNPTARKHVM